MKVNFKACFYITLCTLIAASLGQVLNSWLNARGLCLYLLGFWVAYPGYRLSFGRGLLIVVILGLHLDATAPWPLGTQSMIGAFIYIGIQLFRHQTAKHIQLSFTALAFFANTAGILILALINIWLAQNYGVYSGLILMMVAVSGILIYAGSPLWCSWLDKIIDRTYLRHAS